MASAESAVYTTSLSLAVVTAPLTSAVFDLTNPNSDFSDSVNPSIQSANLNPVVLTWIR